MTKRLMTMSSGPSVPALFLDVLHREKRIGIALVVQDAYDDQLVGLGEIVDAEVIKSADRPSA